MPVTEARLYTTIGGVAECRLCPHFCRIPAGKRGICGVRENRDGRLFSRIYGELVAEHADPVEKKPLFHFLPGSRTLSLGAAGCNLRCRHCQNHSISQVSLDADDQVLRGDARTPEEIVRMALQAGCPSISYTYTEPTVSFEFCLDCMVCARESRLKNSIISNGFMSQASLQMQAPFLDAANIDIKSFRDDFYREICGGRLEPVLETVQELKRLGIWVEITTLLIPGLNDSDAELRALAGWIAALDTAIPWHVTAFYPVYKLQDRPATPSATLVRARKIGLEAGLSFVYCGNRVEAGGEDTQCPGCGKTVLRRHGFAVLENLLYAGRCPDCAMVLPGVWQEQEDNLFCG